MPARIHRWHRGKYASHFDGPPPRYTGPTWIGKAITPTRSVASIVNGRGEMPKARGPEWIGKRIPAHPTAGSV